MSLRNDFVVLEEPLLEFRHGQHAVDPHRGLSLFGPYDADRNPPGRVRYCVVGTADGIAAFTAFAEAMARPMAGGAADAELAHPGSARHRLRQNALWPVFPGFNTAFATRWQAQPLTTGVIAPEAIDAALRNRDDHQRVRRIADLFLDPIRIASERDDPPQVVVCVVPDRVWLDCRPMSRVTNGEGARPSKAEVALRRVQPDMFGDYDPEDYDLSTDFRRQLKARALTYRAPIQVVLESTLNLDPGQAGTKTPMTDRAWNLATAIYYKAGGKPWRLASARPGVCYVGLTFKLQDPGDTRARSAACAAQMFLDTGDGVVFRGESSAWYSPETRDFTLGRDHATQLLCGVLTTYREQGGQPLQEVFLHAHSQIPADDFAGFRDACPPNTRLVGIRVRRASETARLYRPGKYPVLRGTLWIIDDRIAYLWTNGFKPHLLTYDGSMVPAPLRIDIQHGEADIRQVAADILGLTKLNYNACRAGDAMPVTVKFSDRVGEILVSNPVVTERQPNFKFYI
jgi:hypothetical protein